MKWHGAWLYSYWWQSTIIKACCFCEYLLKQTSFSAAVWGGAPVKFTWMTTAPVCRKQTTISGHWYEPPPRRAAGKFSPGPPAPSGQRWCPYSQRTESWSRIFSLLWVHRQPSSATEQDTEANVIILLLFPVISLPGSVSAHYYRVFREDELVLKS